MPQHIYSDYDHAIRRLQEDLLTMATLARQNLEQAMQALLRADTDLANTVIAADSDVDELERKVDQIGMEILVRFHPVATDLRLIIASMKISTNLERISDHAVNIAKRARKINKGQPLPEVQWLEPLYAQTYALLRDALDSYTNHDPALGQALHAKDKELDRLHKQLARSLSSQLETANGRSDAWLHLIFIARSLERIGDLSVNIGEETVFLESAIDIRHEYRKQALESNPPLL
ncbi:MAG: phosphate signaling complex protein PhoU [Verrucomicrobiota bacterium]